MRRHFFKKSKKRLVLFLGFFLALLCLLFGQCRKSPRNGSVILITLDTQRADFISSYHPSQASTPHLDYLADRGILFENCYCLIPITLPSHASLFFSKPPHEVKNYNNGQIIRRKKKRQSLVTIFRKHGYTTAAFVSLGVLKSRFGLEEGFDVYKDDFPKERWYLSADEVNQNVFPWLEQHRHQRFFLWIHYSDPHDPYAPPDLKPDLRLVLNEQPVGEYHLGKYLMYEVELHLKKGKNELRFEVSNEYSEGPDQFQARLDLLELGEETEGALDSDFTWGWFLRREDNIIFLKNNAFLEIENSSSPRTVKLSFRGKPILTTQGVWELYRREVEFMDGEIGKLWEKLRELGLFDKTHILIAGDHGEGLGEYLNYFGDPHIGHIHFLNEVYMRVPLILYGPSLSKKSQRVSEPVTLLDIAPTLAEMAGLGKFSGFQGRNLLHLKDGENLEIFQETYKPEAVKDKFAVRSFPWHLILTPEENRFELFDLRADPQEKKNIFEAGQLPPGAERLRKKLDSLVREVLKGKEEIKIDKSTEEMLRALGYIR